MDEAWVSHNKVRAREVADGIDIEVEGVSTQARYYKPLIYEFFRKTWRGARPAWGEFSVEILMDYVGDPPWLDLDNLAKAILDAIKGFAFHDDAQVCRLVVARNPSEVERVRIMVRRVRDLPAWPRG